MEEVCVRAYQFAVKSYFVLIHRFYPLTIVQKPLDYTQTFVDGSKIPWRGYSLIGKRLYITGCVQSRRDDIVPGSECSGECS